MENRIKIKKLVFNSKKGSSLSEDCLKEGEMERVRWGNEEKRRDRRTKRKNERQSKRDLEEVLIVFP